MVILNITMYMTCTLIYQVKLINTAIDSDNAKGSSRLRGCIEEDRHDVPLEDCWYARPQLFFTCVTRPKNGRLPKDKRSHTGPDDIVYRSTPWFSSVPLKSLTCL